MSDAASLCLGFVFFEIIPLRPHFMELLFEGCLLSISNKRVRFRYFLCPLALAYVCYDVCRPEEATPEWRLGKHWHQPVPWSAYPIPVSILHPPNLERAQRLNAGYIMVAVTSCCASWNVTERLLKSLLSSAEPLHVVLVDDNSKV